MWGRCHSRRRRRTTMLLSRATPSPRRATTSNAARTIRARLDVMVVETSTERSTERIVKKDASLVDLGHGPGLDPCRLQDAPHKRQKWSKSPSRTASNGWLSSRSTLRLPKRPRGWTLRRFWTKKQSNNNLSSSVSASALPESIKFRVSGP